MRDIFLLGNGGMLGHIAFNYLKESNIGNVHGFGRETLPLYPMSSAQIYRRLTKHIGLKADFVINCIGAIKPHFKNKSNLLTNIYVNSIFPHQLADWGDKTNTKVLHISTDCVFKGDLGLYTENFPHDTIDLYGKSKSLGESDKCMVLRTSIIGPENKTKKSLFEWLRSNKGKTVKGFTNHLWNGMTTLQLSKVFYSLIKDELFCPGVFHIFSNDINKYNLLNLISSIYGWNIEVRPANAPFTCDRTLRTTKELNDSLNIPSIKKQVEELIAKT